MTRRPPWGGTRGRVAAGIGAAIGLAVLGWFVWRPDPPSRASERAAAVAFRTGPVQRLIDDAGAVIVHGIKPALPDLLHGQLAPEQFRSDASGWRAQLERARSQFGACPPPERLRAAARIYDQAMGEYERALDAFVAASTQPAAELRAAISAAARNADEADRTWDRAATAVASELQRLGLPERPRRPAGQPAGCAA